MDAFLADPTVKVVIIGLIAAFGAYLIALFRHLASQLDQARSDIGGVAKIATATITLVDGQLTEVKGQLREMALKWQTSVDREARTKEGIADTALQTAKDKTAQVELQAVKDLAAQEVQAAKNLLIPPPPTPPTPLVITNGGSAQSTQPASKQ